jgi:hypothetical protein
MASDNIYNQPGAQKIYLTLANQTDTVLADDMGKCKIAISTDEKFLNFTDQNGVKYKCDTIRYSGTSPPAILGNGLMWFNPNTGWLMYRKRAEDGEHVVYPVNLADPIPE